MHTEHTVYHKRCHFNLSWNFCPIHPISHRFQVDELWEWLLAKATRWTYSGTHNGGSVTQHCIATSRSVFAWKAILYMQHMLSSYISVFKLCVGNWMTDHFGSQSVSKSREAIMICGVNLIFQIVGCAGFSLSRSLLVQCMTHSSCIACVFCVWYA